MQHYWKIFNEFVCFSRVLSSEYPSVCRTFKAFSPIPSYSRVCNNRAKHNEKLRLVCKQGQFDVVEIRVNNQLLKAFSINLNAQHANGMTPMSVHTRLIDTLE